MRFDFYFVNHSFTYQEEIEKSELEDKIKSLAIDYNYIRQYKDTDKIFINPTIYDVLIFPGFTVVDFLYSSNSKKYFDRDIILYLSTIIDKSDETSLTTEEVIEVILPEHSNENVSGLLCLNKIQGIDDIYLVYNKNNWFDFHRHFLGLYPQTPAYFITECDKYLPELYIHKNNINSIHGILSNSSIKIIHYLTELNNNFKKSKSTTNSRIDLLKKFNTISNFDIKASIEGDIKRKKNLTFHFQNENGINEAIYCELHLKLLYDDNNKKVQHRIYFHDGKKDIENDKILIGYIGSHL